MITLDTVIAASTITLDIELISSEVTADITVGGDTAHGFARAFESLAQNSLVYVREDGKLALASSIEEGREATAFVRSACAPEQPTKYFTLGVIDGMAGLVPGSPYFMSATPGAISAVPPSIDSIGSVVLKIGTAMTTTSLSFKPDTAITL